MSTSDDHMGDIDTTKDLRARELAPDDQSEEMADPADVAANRDLAAGEEPESSAEADRDAAER